VPGAASDVGDAAPGAHARDDLRGGGKESVEKLLVVDAAPQVVHRVCELRAEGLIGDSPAGTEAVLDGSQVSTEMLDDCRHRGQVARAGAGEQGGMVRREPESARSGLVAQDPPVAMAASHSRT